MSGNKILWILIGLLLLFLSPLVIKSTSLIAKADKLVKEDKLEEALLYYNESQRTFPLFIFLTSKIGSTKVLLDSELEYGQIDQIYAETQVVPPASVPTLNRPLGPGEIFIPILMYHHIRVNPRPYDSTWASLNVSPSLLDSELNYLVNNGYHVITLDDLENALVNGGSLPDNPIVLTFDDGYENFYTDAYPILKKHNLKATIFVITQGVANNAAYLTWPQIKEMNDSGLITIGAHTQHHPNLPDLTDALIQNEIVGSRDDIKNHLGSNPKWFAYPYGSYTNFIVSEVRTAGFSGAVSTIFSAIQNKERLYLLPRIMADGRFSLDEFAKRLQK